MKTILTLTVATLIALPVGVCRAAMDVIRIDMAEAYMLEGPGTEFPISTKITDDDALSVVSHRGDWLEVKMDDGTVGWINRVLLSPEDQTRYPGETKAPPAGDSSGGSLLDDIRPGFTADGDPDLTASAGTRGIGMENGGSGRGGKDYQAIRYMESFFISDSEVDGFIREGGLTP